MPRFSTSGLRALQVSHLDPWAHIQVPHAMMMISFVTIKSSLVPLIEGPCAHIYFRFEISMVLYSHLLLFFFGRKNMLKEKRG